MGSIVPEWVHCKRQQECATTRKEGIFEVECILKVVGGRGAVQSIPSTLLVWRKTSPIFTPILLVSGGP